ncbi:MAG TPA: hypothetical protein ENN34_06665, partial [Deltaproteobacteria bacterium]|nr:hypothetical protein [Deltaproteobacteria bacterium]
MQEKGPYDLALLFVSGVRVYEHLNTQPPSIAALSVLLRISEEELTRISRRLDEKGIISIVRSGADVRVVVADHTKIEEIPKVQESPKMLDEISQFKSKQQSRLKEIEEALGKNSDKASMFSELEKALRDPSTM